MIKLRSTCCSCTVSAAVPPEAPPIEVIWTRTRSSRSARTTISTVLRATSFRSEIDRLRRFVAEHVGACVRRRASARRLSSSIVLEQQVEPMRGRIRLGPAQAGHRGRRMAVSGWFSSWAIDALISAIVPMRFIRTTASFASRSSRALSRRSVMSA